MKRKILYALILFIPLIVNAEEKFYTSYYLKESNSVNYKEESETIKREEIKLYNTYILQRKDKGYFENNNEFIKDENDYIEETVYYQTKKDNTIQHIYYEQEEDVLVNKFQIRNFSTSGQAKIESIKIYHKNELIYESSTDIITVYTKLIFTLNDYYNLKDIKIDILINDPKMWIFSGTLTAYSVNTQVDNKFKYIRTSTKDLMTIIFLNKEDYKDLSSNITWYKDGDTYFTAYPKNVKKYKYYDYEKVYLNKYTNIESSTYFLDYNDCKIVYNYYERYYLILSDIIIDANDLTKQIIDTNINVNDLIINKNETATKYIIKIKYLDDEITKTYDKELIVNNKSQIEESDNNEVPITESIKIKTTSKIKQIANKPKKTFATTTKKILEPHTTTNKIVEEKTNNNLIKYISFTFILLIFLLLLYIKKYLKKK